MDNRLNSRLVRNACGIIAYFCIQSRFMHFRHAYRSIKSNPAFFSLDVNMGVNKMNYKKTYNKLVTNPFAMICVALVSVVLLAVMISQPMETSGKTYHVKTWTEMMAERNATTVTKNTQSVCNMLYNTNATTFDAYGIRCIRNTFYLDKTCGPKSDQFCDCICYL